nr:uncharacterized protein LOC113692928 [Coffea arabica]
MANAKLLEHNPLPQINEVKFCRHELLRVAEHLGYAPDYFFTVDGNPTNLKVSQGDLMDSKFVAAVDKNEVKVHKLKDGDVPRNRNGLDLEKIRDDANGGCYDWKMSGQYLEATLGDGLAVNPEPTYASCLIEDPYDFHNSFCCFVRGRFFVTTLALLRVATSRIALSCAMTLEDAS